jgi:hypothetical protein
MIVVPSSSRIPTCERACIGHHAHGRMFSRRCDDMLEGGLRRVLNFLGDFLTIVNGPRGRSSRGAPDPAATSEAAASPRPARSLRRSSRPQSFDELTKHHGAAIPNRLVDVGLKLQRSGGGLERQRYLLCGRGAREACLRPTVRARGVQARRAARRCVLLHQEGPETVQSAQPSTPHRDVDTSAGVELPADEVDNRFDCCDDVCGQRPRSQRFNQESAQRSRNARRTWSSRGLTK